MAMVDTNSNPVNVDYVIPSNDDAIRAIKLIVGKMADAVLEGSGLRKDVDIVVDSYEQPDYNATDVNDLHDADDEKLLGASTRAKIRSFVDDEIDEVI